MFMTPGLLPPPTLSEATRAHGRWHATTHNFHAFRNRRMSHSALARVHSAIHWIPTPIEPSCGMSHLRRQQYAEPTTQCSCEPGSHLPPAPSLVSVYKSVSSHLRPALLRLRSLPRQCGAAVIILGGSFNPIHCGHVAMLHHAQQYLKSLSPPIVTVAALLALATDDWIQGKDIPPHECLQFEERLRLCQAAASSSDIIIPVPYPAGNQFSELRRTQNALMAASGCTSLLGFSLMGADTFQRLNSARYTPIIAFVRADFPFDFDDARRNNPQLHIVHLSHHLMSLSSTKCRALMRAGAWDELVEDGLLPPAVVDVLRDAWQPPPQQQHDGLALQPCLVLPPHPSSFASSSLSLSLSSPPPPSTTTTTTSNPQSGSARQPLAFQGAKDDSFLPEFPFPDAGEGLEVLQRMLRLCSVAHADEDVDAGDDLDDHDFDDEALSGIYYEHENAHVLPVSWPRLL